MQVSREELNEVIVRKLSNYDCVLTLTTPLMTYCKASCGFIPCCTVLMSSLSVAPHCVVLFCIVLSNFPADTEQLSKELVSAVITLQFLSNKKTGEQTVPLMS